MTQTATNQRNIMTEKFKDYVTSTAFSLTLSRPMIECVSQLHQVGASWANASTFYALENRGLAERVQEKGDLPESLVAQLHPRCRLTEAGLAVIPLLKLSGLYVKYDKRHDAVELPPATITLKQEQS